MKNRPVTLNKQPGTIKNQKYLPGTMNSHKNPPGTMEIQHGTITNRFGTMKGYKNPPGTMKTNLEQWKTMKTNLEL